MLRIITSISLSLFILASSNARPLVKCRQDSLARQTSSDEWESGNFEALEGLTVRRIEFHGIPNTPDRVVRRAIWIKEGDIFTRAGLERGIRRLNRLGLFERITEGDISWQKGKDVFTSNEVDFIVRVKEKRRR